MPVFNLQALNSAEYPTQQALQPHLTLSSIKTQACKSLLNILIHRSVNKYFYA